LRPLGILTGSDGLRHALAVLAAAGLVALALPAGAAAAGATSPASSLIPTTTTPTATQTPATSTGPVTVAPPASSSSSSGGISSLEEIGIFVAAALLIAVIARIIMSDARGHTPAGDAPDWERERGTVKPLEQRIKESRAKAKRARRARRAGR
jgi:hypothetical protein